MKQESPNWCQGCENNCCDHFVLENWSQEKIKTLIEKFPFLSVDEHWQGEDDSGRTVDVWIMECARLNPDGSCEGYPDNRPYFCDWAGVRYKPVSGCKLFEKTVMNNPDRSE